MRVRLTPATLSILGLALAWEQPVSAYIDPGSGSLIYQALLAAVLGVGFAFRRVRALVARLTGRSDSPAPVEPPRHTL